MATSRDCTHVIAIATSAWSIVTLLFTLLQRNSFLRLSGTIRKQSLAAGGALSNRAATLAMANRPRGSYAPAIFTSCASNKMATRTLRELEESPRMFKSVLQSPYNLKWLDSRVFDAVYMCPQLVKVALGTHLVAV